ncbi:MAG TPA: LysM peptidoglycan-binding domain-containing protein [Trebonia sp.]
MNPRLAVQRDGRIRTRQALPPVRPARPGRLTVTGVSALIVGLLSVLLATTAHAAHGGSASPGKYVVKVMVLPGQSLWSLAEKYDPGADPRAISEQIRQLNSMPGDQLQAGQILWVPRG